MNRTSMRRADSSRQLDLFSFVPAALPRRQPAPEETPVALPFPERSIPPEPRPPEPPPIIDLRESGPFRILDRHKVGQGSLARKCRDNLAALTLLKRLESEGRPATHDERAVLLRYVCWGGLPQVFDERNPNWTGERAELGRLLSKDELRSAADRAAWFSEARRCLTRDGRIVLVEHLRDAANFMAFGPGFVHFHSATTWRRARESVGLSCADSFCITAFVRVFVLRLHD